MEDPRCQIKEFEFCVLSNGEPLVVFNYMYRCVGRVIYMNRLELSNCSTRLCYYMKRERRRENWIGKDREGEGKGEGEGMRER